MNGTAGATQAEMARVLSLSADRLAAVNRDYGELLALSGRGGDVKFSLANSIWTSPIFQGMILPAFYETMRAFYGGACFPCPPTHGPINEWVEAHTNGKIKNLITGLDPNLVMILINCVYFYGNWQTQFQKQATRNAPFHLFTGVTKSVPMMALADKMAYLENSAYQAVSLPYKNPRFRAIIVLPRDPSPAGMEAVTGRMENHMRSLLNLGNPSKGTLFLPRFRLEWGQEMIPYMNDLGMRLPFGSDSDFTNMASVRPGEFYIGMIQHKAFIEVNEEGTEAAAATAVHVLARSMAVAQPWEMRCDHPFLFFIAHGDLPIFAARVVEPM